MPVERKRTAEYNRGREDALTGAGPDYGQATTQLLMDYIAGYRKGKRERAQTCAEKAQQGA